MDADLLSRFDLIIVMERGHKEALDQEFPFASQKTHMISYVADKMVYDVFDPMHSGQAIDMLAADLYKIVERGYPTICTLAQNTPPSN